FKAEGTVASVTDARRFAVSGLDSFGDGWFTGGKLVWTGGANNARAMEVKRHAGASIELWQSMSEAVAVGDVFAINFRGFPTMPGNDAVLSYPTAAQPMNGGSRYGN